MDHGLNFDAQVVLCADCQTVQWGSSVKYETGYALFILHLRVSKHMFRARNNPQNAPNCTDLHL